jgi:hypothetical protein
LKNKSILGNKKVSDLCKTLPRLVKTTNMLKNETQNFYKKPGQFTNHAAFFKPNHSFYQNHASLCFPAQFHERYRFGAKGTSFGTKGTSFGTKGHQIVSNCTDLVQKGPVLVQKGTKLYQIVPIWCKRYRVSKAGCFC